MAGALRKVSLNYKWTIKRAQNDLHHNIISPQPQPQPTSPSFPDTKPLDFSVLPWDLHRLRWKFKNDYEELREHLDRAFLIIFGWVVTLNHLRTIATWHFINHPIRSVVVLYEESGILPHLGIRPTSIWGLLVSLSRSVAPFIISWFWEIFGAFLLVHASAPEASTGEKIDTSFVPKLAEHHAVAEEPEWAPPQVSNDSEVQAPAKDHTGNDTSDAAPPLPVMSVTDVLNGENGTMPTVTQDDTRQFSSSLRKARSHDDIESDNARQAQPGLITRGSFHVHGSQPSPKSPDSVLHHIEAKAARMSHPKDDVFTMGDYSILTLNPAVFAP